MKRYRHYQKEKAIILSVFGSVIEQQKYLELKEQVQKRFEGMDVFVSVSSRMVLKDLIRRGFEYKTLAQTLADVDALGYKNIIVASINLFPTDEHNLLKKTVEGFKQFSFANIRATNAIVTKTKETSLFLKYLDDTISKEQRANLYIIHGVPRLDIVGLDSVSYTEGFLKQKRELNLCASLEGAYPFYATKEAIVRELQNKGVKEVQVVPMLLVSGNHYIKDMVEIRDELREHFTCNIVESITPSEHFNLLEIEHIRKMILQNIEEEIIKLGC